MLDHKKVRNLINNYYISFGEVYSKDSRRRIDDENTILEVKNAFYIIEQAQVSFQKQEPGKRDEEADEFARQATHEQATAWFTNRGTTSGLKYTLDYYIDKLIYIYGLNGDKNKYPQNRVIWKIIESPGHNVGLADDESYYMLKGKARPYGEAILRYVARNQNFDMDNIDVQIVQATAKDEPDRITIDFQRIPVLNARPKRAPEPQKVSKEPTATPNMQDSEEKGLVPSDEDLTSVTKKHIDYAKKMLSLAKNDDDFERVMYWSERIKLSEIQMDINMANDQIKTARESYDDATVARWEAIKDDLEKQIGLTRERFKDFHKGVNLANTAIENARISDDKPTIAYWESILSGIKNDVEDIIESKSKQM